MTERKPLPIFMKTLATAYLASTLPSQLAHATEGAQTYTGLEEVVVSARKRRENLQDIPVSVTALTSETLQKYDVTSLEKVASMTPSFTVGRTPSGSGAQLTMRGIGSSSTSISIEQSVAVVVDDVYYGQGRIINEGMFDMERIEVLKGPQALFFGKNATAGVISLTSASPTPHFSLSGKIGHEFEAEQTYAEGVISGPITDTIGVRLALRGSTMDGGYFENRARDVVSPTFDIATGTLANHIYAAGAKDTPQEDEFMGRLSVAFDPSDVLSINLKASATHSENNNPSWNNIIYKSPTGFSSLDPTVPVGDAFVFYQNDDAADIAARFPYVDNDGSLGSKYDSQQATISINYQIGNMTLTSVTNGQKNKNRFACDCDFQSAPDGTVTTEESEWEAFSEELRLITDFDSSVNFMIGILYQKTSRDFDQHIQLAGLEDSSAPAQYRYHGVHKNSSQDGETISPFFQVMWKPIDNLEMSVGGRYTDESKDSRFVQPYVNAALQGLWLQGVTRTGRQNFSEFSPEFTVNYHITPDVMVYGAYKTAYKSGGFSISGLVGASSTQDDFEFDPETANGFEAGVKSTLLNGQLRFNATAYWYEFEDLQVDFFNSPSFAFVTLNAGSAITQGIELESQYAPFKVPGLTISGALNYNDASYDDFVAPCWSGQRPSQGCNTVVPGTAGTPGTDISDAPTSMAPKWTASFGVDYEVPMFSDMTLDLGANLLYSSDYNPSAFNNRYSKRGSYTKVDAAVRLKSADERWEIAVIGKNLTDEFIVTGAFDAPSTGVDTGTESGVFADQIGFVSLPRTIAIQASYRY